MTRFTGSAEKISVVNLPDDEREEYLENLWVKHGFTPERLLSWLAAHRSAEYWKLDKTTYPNVSQAEKIHTYGIYFELRGATYDHSMQEVAVAIWESRERPEFVRFWGVDFYPIMDGLLLLLSHFMDSLAIGEKIQGNAYRGDQNAIDFSMDWITFHMRYYIAQHWRLLRK